MKAYKRKSKKSIADSQESQQFNPILMKSTDRFKISIIGVLSEATK